RPHTVLEAVELLSEMSGRPRDRCQAVLKEFLSVTSRSEEERKTDRAGQGRSFLAFKLHQFISGAGHAFATLEAPGKRVVTVEGQQFLPGAQRSASIRSTFVAIAVTSTIPSVLSRMEDRGVSSRGTSTTR